MAKQVATDTLRNFAKKSKVNEVEKLTFGEEGNTIEFKLKKYLPIEDKRTIVELISSRIFMEDEIRVLKYQDKSIEDILAVYCVIKYYTNINETEDLFEMYDIAVSTGLMDFIKENLPEGELDSLSEMIDVRIDEELRLQELENSTGYQLESMMDMLIRKITEALDTMKDFNPEELNVFGTGTAIEDAQREVDDTDVVIKDNKENLKVVKEDSNNVIGDSED